MRMNMLLPRITRMHQQHQRRRRRFSHLQVSTARVGFVILLLLAFIYYLQSSPSSSGSSTAVPALHQDRNLPHFHEISPASISIAESYLSSSPPPATAHLPRSLAYSFCALHNFTTYSAPPSSSAGAAAAPLRKVYDLFLLSAELDWLEIRLATLYDVVDYFVILEATLTFTGHEKPLLLARDGPGSSEANSKNWDRIKRFEDKIIYRVVEGMPRAAKRPWDREDWQRDALVRQGVFGLLKEEKGKGERRGGKRPELGDVLVVSDVDEIPRPTTLMVLRNCEVPRRVTLRSNFYYYGFMWRHRGPEWPHGQATIYAGEQDTILPVNLRNGDGEGFWSLWSRRSEKTDIWNAGWHCSTCFQKVEEVLGKMASFSHVSFNQEGFRNPEWIAYCARAGIDIWNRKGQVFDRIDGNQDIPELVKTSDRFKYLRDREGPNGGFVDYEVQDG